MNSDFDELMMRQALDEARIAESRGEIPVGAVVTFGERIIARAHNLRETLHDPTAHAERLAITQAGEVLQSWRLGGCALYVTLEPCAMCAGSIVLARLDRVVYGAEDPKAGACRSLFRLADDTRLNHRASITPGVLAAECGQILQDFFARKRRISVRKNDSPLEGCLSG